MTTERINDSLGLLSTLTTPFGKFDYVSLRRLAQNGYPHVDRYPVSIKVLLESVLRSENGREVTREHVDSLLTYDPHRPDSIEVPFKPARVLLQDFTGVPCVVDLAAMRSAMARLGGDPKRINPELMVNLVIDHSVQVDYFNSSDALRQNAQLEFQRNRERYEFLRWGQAALRNFHVVPPASGICHQVNLEYLGKIVQTSEVGGRTLAFFDSLVGTDSHTPMINGLGIVGWGVGGIEAEAAMLGQPLFMLAPRVVGVRLTGRLRSGITATDLVLTITEMLRRHGVVGKFVEFFGRGLSAMTVPDRATISNMAPEYGATIGYFPIDQQCLDYMYATGRPQEVIDLAELYAVEQGVFRTDDTPDPDFETVLELDLDSVEASVAGPKRPQDRIALGQVKSSWRTSLTASYDERGFQLDAAQLNAKAPVRINGHSGELTHGDVVIAAITSCTNTSNPSVLLAAGLLAKKAVEKGLSTRPFIKTSFAPGSMVVTEYLQRAGLMPYLEQLGFYLVGYGCTTCIGNSGPLPEPVRQAVEEAGLVVAGVLSGNRNFEGRINPHTRANFLASPPLVVAYALAGNMDIDLETEPLGCDSSGAPVFMRDIWPSDEELAEYVQKALDRDAFIESYRGLETSNPQWNSIELAGSDLYQWDDSSTYIQEPSFFDQMTPDARPIAPISAARCLVMAGDSITTDHISPAGAIDPDSPAGRYLLSMGVEVRDFNSYGSRRGNDRVMTRGTFANIRFRNLLAPGTEGSWTVHHPTGERVSIFEAAERYRKEGTPSIVLAGKDYGMGSSRDWAAKGSFLLGIRVVIAESFERIHRSNLVGMGVLPLQFAEGESYRSIGLDGGEQYAFAIDDDLKPAQDVVVTAAREDGTSVAFTTRCRIDSPVEVEYYRNGGILQTVLRKFLQESRS
ncbi:MAG: aconitate hydratase AcnA [Spirochaetaceae bacterium]|nr:MAG: aconitate hydratase AcnA [Spirochaetaceae bacterium]